MYRGPTFKPTLSYLRGPAAHSARRLTLPNRKPRLSRAAAPIGRGGSKTAERRFRPPPAPRLPRRHPRFRYRLHCCFHRRYHRRCCRMKRLLPRTMMMMLAYLKPAPLGGKKVKEWCCKKPGAMMKKSGRKGRARAATC